jgi:uncharacterized membrane protein
MSTIAAALAPKNRTPLDRRPWFRWILGIAAALLTGLSCYAVTRTIAGIAPDMPHLRTPALLIHLATAIPAVPLGAWLLLKPKGDALHRLLGKVWLALMTVTAIAAIFIRTINNGQFSWIHLFVVLTLVSVPRTYFAARRGDIAKHRDVVLGLYLGAALLAGFAAFVPHRTMWWMAFG